jgi:hypothetical protein
VVLGIRLDKERLAKALDVDPGHAHADVVPAVADRVVITLATAVFQSKKTGTFLNFPLKAGQFRNVPVYPTYRFIRCWLPTPRICQPYPEARLRVIIRGKSPVR